MRQLKYLNLINNAYYCHYDCPNFRVQYGIQEEVSQLAIAGCAAISRQSATDMHILRFKMRPYVGALSV